ncbi:ABC transporter, putative [Anopheles sinensis]|uniref:ABC transporter, putative n=1 Tax=Anopheles sinensis TaxID=74873 RepID=A0A084WV00_ANOSI|nr:ABC transporter, putative [Anopheles sinensis]
MTGMRWKNNKPNRSELVAKSYGTPSLPVFDRYGHVGEKVEPSYVLILGDIRSRWGADRVVNNVAEGAVLKNRNQSKSHLDVLK